MTNMMKAVAYKNEYVRTIQPSDSVMAIIF
ncbi:hypothetical protein AT864_02798 [Anoxybacillus sp. P3H1B]|nr:hypothetical protein AT864_02798 [Anoxybacillus sp. P3H1B]